MAHTKVAGSSFLFCAVDLVWSDVLSFVLDVPVQLLMALLLAMPAGEDLHLAVSPEVAEAPPPVVRAYQGFGEGGFKFREQSWLEALKSQQDVAEFRGYARRIFHTSDGFHYVPNDAERRAILGLRDIPAIAQGVSARLAQRNARRLRMALGRTANPSDLYLAHCLGIREATALVKLIEQRPRDPAYFHVAKIAPDFPIEALVPHRTATLSDLRAFVDGSIVAATQAAARQNLLRTWQPDLRDSFAGLVAGQNHNLEPERLTVATP